MIDRLRAVLADDTFAVRFEVEREVGRGGMGSVHRALDRTTGQPVAIKLVQAASLQARFALEAETLERLAHPAIVAYVGHGVTRDGGAYLAMTWLEGESLADRLTRSTLSIADTLAAGVRIAGALAHAHAEGIVHRDIKPSNVMLVDGDPRRATLIDFGIAKDTVVTHGLTETGQLVGTPGYMAPEQAMGVERLDARTDLFAFGCLLYHCLTGQPPFDGRQPMEVLAHLLLKDPPAVQALVPAVPARLSSLVAALMVKEPAQRPGDAVAVEAELAAIAGAIANAETANLAAPSPLHAPVDVGTAPTRLERLGAAAQIAATLPAAGEVPRRSRTPFVVAGLALALFGIAAAILLAMREPRTSTLEQPATAPIAEAPATSTDDAEPVSAIKHPCEKSGSVVCELMCYGDDAWACRVAGKIAHAAARGNDLAQRAAIDNLLVRGCDLGDARACVLAATWMRRRTALGDTTYTRAEWVARFERGCDLRDGAACNLLAKHLSEEAPTENFAAALALYERGCEHTNTASCLRASEMRLRRGGEGDAARAAELRAIACKRGHVAGCAPQ